MPDITARESLTGDLAEFLNKVKTEHALTSAGKADLCLGCGPRAEGKCGTRRRL